MIVNHRFTVFFKFQEFPQNRFRHIMTKRPKMRE